MSRKRKTSSRTRINPWQISSSFLLFALVGAFFWIAENQPTPVLTPPRFFLGPSTVTKYSHKDDNEVYGRWTASGHILSDWDAGYVCAVSRDWWKTVVKPGDFLEIEGHGRCRVLDTMAIRNQNGFPQRRWVDIYEPNQENARSFGMDRRNVWLVKRPS